MDKPNKQEHRHNNPVPEELRQLDVCCPQCLSPMKLRHSKYGPFFGCSHYPSCTGIRTPENATALAEFQEALEQVLISPANSEEILFNPDAPSHVWYEVHGLRLTSPTATEEAQGDLDRKAPEDSEKILEESE